MDEFGQTGPKVVSGKSLGSRALFFFCFLVFVLLQFWYCFFLVFFVLFFFG